MMRLFLLFVALSGAAVAQVNPSIPGGTVLGNPGTAYAPATPQRMSTYLASPPAIGGTTPAAGAFTTLSASSGTFTAVAGGVTIGSPTGGAEGAGTLNMAGCYVNGVACGSALAFNGITSGTNTAAAMLVGTGSSLAPTGTGTITASGLNATALGTANTWTALQTFGTNITVNGVNYPTQTLQLGASAGAPLAFGAGNSLLYTNGAAGGITLQGFATNPGNDVMIAPFDIYIASDTADTSHTLGSNTSMNWFSVEGHAKAGHVGGRTPINARLFIDGAPTATTNAAYSAGTFVTSVAVNLTGATGIYQNYAGSVYGANPNVFTQAGATFINQINAQESDVALALGSSAAEKHAMTLVQTGTDSVRAVYDDAALEYTAQDRWNATCTTSPLAINTTTCTMASGSGMTAGDFVVVFHDTAQDVRYIACTGADPSLVCTWSPGLTSATTLVGGDDIGNVAPWAYGINFGSYAHLAPFWQTLTATDTNVFTGSTLIGFSNRTVGGAMTANANIGIDFHNVNFSTYSLDLPGFTVGPIGQTFAHSLTTDTAYSYSVEQGVVGFEFFTPAATLTDTAGASSPTHTAATSLGVPTFTSANAIASTNVETLYVAAPLVAGSFTDTNLWSIYTNGNINTNSLTTRAGATIGGAAVSINNNSSFAVNICTGTCNSGVNIGSGASDTGTNLIGNTSGGATNLASKSLQLNGVLYSSITAPTVTSGLGTSPTVTAASTAAFEITTGGSGTPSTTVVLAMPTASNGWACVAQDVTTSADVAKETAYATNSVTFTISTAPSLSDKLVFNCGAF